MNDDQGDNPDVSDDENQSDNSGTDGDEQGENLETEGITGVTADAAVSKHYTISRQQINTLANGVNLIKYSDGTTRKVLVK